MERISIVDEKNNQKSSNVTPVSESVASHVMIDSISINLGVTVDKKVIEKCHHFSLRGYVADMRNKDVKICAPFHFDGVDESKLREQLAPLHVANFRWWRCQSCVQDISAVVASESQENIENTSPNLIRGDVNPSACIHKEEKNALVEQLPVCGQEDGVKDVSKKQTGDQTLGLAECLSCPIQERHINGTG